jgi:hypothetical protein
MSHTTRIFSRAALLHVGVIKHRTGTLLRWRGRWHAGARAGSGRRLPRLSGSGGGWRLGNAANKVIERNASVASARQIRDLNG